MIDLKIGDCRDILQEIPEESINCCVTSPPYFGLRDYGHDKQIGLEASPEEYVKELVDVFREVRRVLRDDGTLWLNLGDSYANNGPGGCQGKNGDRANRTFTAYVPAHKGEGLKAKDIMGIPWRVAFALQGFAVVPFHTFTEWADILKEAREIKDWELVKFVEDQLRMRDILSAFSADGWYLRQDIIWHKPNPMPESVKDRCTKAHEYIFLLSKSPRYYFNQEAILEPCSPATHARLSQKTLAQQAGSSRSHGGQKHNGPMKAVGRKFDPAKGNKNNQSFDAAMSVMPENRNKRSVWSITTQPYKGSHFATFPLSLVEPCILAGCPEGGTVLDPFGGSGTVGEFCRKNNRKAVLIELNPEYKQLINERAMLGYPEITSFA